MINATELIDRLTPIAGGKRGAVERRMQDWLQQAGLPRGKQVAGRNGRERIFDPEAMLLAGIAAALSRWKVPVPVIKLVLAAMLARETKPQKGQPDSGRLRHVIDGQDLILILQHGGDREGVRYYFVPRGEMAAFLASPESGGEGLSQITIDLPKLWQAVAATGFEPKAGAAVQAAVDAEVITAAAKAAARASRDEIESRRLAMEERRLRDRKKAMDAKLAAHKAREGAAK